MISMNLKNNVVQLCSYLHLEPEKLSLTSFYIQVYEYPQINFR